MNIMNLSVCDVFQLQIKKFPKQRISMREMFKISSSNLISKINDKILYDSQIERRKE